MSELLLGVDGGQTGTRALLASTEGAVLGRGEAGPVRHLFGDGGEETRTAITAAIRAAFADAGLAPGVVTAAVCGITSVRPGSAEAAKVEESVRSVVSPRLLEVVPDYVTNLLGASVGGPGVVVVAGGGSVAYGLSADGREATAGGFGYLLGDEGGGYDIGRRGLTAVIRAEDGRGEPTALCGPLLAALGVPHVGELKPLVYAPGFGRDRIAALVPLVAEAARGGDAEAQRILTEAGGELADLALAVLRRLFERGDRVNVYPTGGVFAAGEPLTGTFAAQLAREWPRAEIGTSAHPPVVGALVRALRLAGYNSMHLSVSNC